MRYVNKDGEPVSKEVWRTLFRNARYGQVARDTSGDLVVDTSWVGVVFDKEKRPGVFLTRTYSGSFSKGQVVPRHDDWWSETLGEAEAAHAAQCREMKFKPKGV